MQPVDKLLTVEQTLGLVFSLTDQPNFHRLRRANPAAIQSIRKIINDVELELYHPDAYRIVGYIGEAQDFIRLEDRLHEFSGMIHHDRRKTISAMFDAIGLGCGRGEKTSCEIAQRMQEVAYWSNCKFKWDEPEVATAIPFAYESIIRFFYGYSLSLDASIDAKIKEIQDSIQNDNLKNNFTFRLNRDKLVELVNQKLSLDDDDPSIEMLDRFYNGNSDRPGPSKPVNSPHSNEVVALSSRNHATQLQQTTEVERKALIADATAAYEAIVNDLIQGEKNVLAKLLDDGNPIADKRLFNRAEMSQNLSQTQALLKKVRALTESPILPHAERYTESINNRIVSDVILVTFELPKTESLGSKFRPKTGSVATVARNGNLVVLMKRIDGRWYWNPFGW